MFVQHHNFGTDFTIRCGQAKHHHNSPDHLHQYYEIDIVFDGEIDVTLNGKTVTARAGDIIVIPSFASHAFYTRERVRMFICVFSGSFLSAKSIAITPPTELAIWSIKPQGLPK